MYKPLPQQQLGELERQLDLFMQEPKHQETLVKLISGYLKEGYAIQPQWERYKMIVHAHRYPL